jgi:3,4-dihydroxy 2-butanone 4-phosphate synthase/GTP cyclohydrolase II
MPLDSVPDILDDIREGKMVILMDDEDRENEGDLVIAAEKVTPEIINFFASEACGLICMPITAERARQLRIPPYGARQSLAARNQLHGID